MELFMIKTGFYNVVTENEAGRFLEGYDERRQRADSLRAALLERHRRGEVKLPESLLRELEGQEKGGGLGEGGLQQQQQQQQQLGKR
jgi:hypothetical protein